MNLNQAAKRLEISYNTAGKYWNYTGQEYCALENEKMEISRSGNEYREDILKQLTEYPEKSAAQINRALCVKNNVTELPKTSFRTFRNLVADIREQNHISKPKNKSRDCR